MINNNEQFFEELAKKYPELMKISDLDQIIEVDEGWFNIIDVLCRCIYNDYETAKNRLRAAIKYPRNDNGLYLAETEKMAEQALSELPTFVQLKEKYGTLRIYVNNETDRVSTLIRFAESMSGLTCEKCGKPGDIDHNGGWIKTHCKDHKYVDIDSTIATGKIIPDFLDDH